MSAVAAVGLGYSLMLVCYYLLPIDRAGYKTLPALFVLVPARAKRTEAGMLVQTGVLPVRREQELGTAGSGEPLHGCLRSAQHHAKAAELVCDTMLAVLLLVALITGITALRAVFAVSWTLPGAGGGSLSSQYTLETFLSTFAACLGGTSALSSTHLRLAQGAATMLALACLLEILVLRVSAAGGVVCLVLRPA
jgi:hypothetical protein